MKKNNALIALMLVSSSSAFANSGGYGADRHQTPPQNNLHQIRQSLEAPSQGNKSYDLFIAELAKKDGRFVDYWPKKGSWNEQVVYQNNALFDMERFQTIEPKLHSKNTGIVDYTDSTLTNTGIDYQNSITKMLQGKPGIGPDNQEIVLCRLVNGLNAPYFEMSKSDFDQAYVLIGSRTPKGVLCLRSIFSATYWQKRKFDFIDYAGDVVQPWR